MGSRGRRLAGEADLAGVGATWREPWAVPRERLEPVQAPSGRRVRACGLSVKGEGREA